VTARRARFLLGWGGRGGGCRKIRLIESNAKCRYLKKIELERDFVAELVVLEDFVFPWGIEYPVVFLPQGLFTFYPVVFANGLVLKNLAKWRDFHYSQIFSQTVTFRGFFIYSRLLICMSVIKHTV
jgi:hypothetical protein